MANPSVTYTFTNGTTADGSQVSQNFADLIAGMTDGTKSFSIDALTVGGAALFNGPVTLGNATGDTITLTGYISGSIIGSTTAGVPHKGRTDGSGPSSTYIGESIQVSGGPVALTSSVPTIVTFTAPTAGYWDLTFSGLSAGHTIGDDVYFSNGSTSTIGLDHLRVSTSLSAWSSQAVIRKTVYIAAGGTATLKAANVTADRGNGYGQIIAVRIA